MFGGGAPQTALTNVTANIAAAGNVTAVVLGNNASPGLQKLVAACLSEIESGTIKDVFLEQLAHYGREPTSRNLEMKLAEAGCPETYYEFAIEAKESFAKFFEIVARHPSGQTILVAAFKHAYSVFREKVNPYLANLTFKQQSCIFEDDVVKFLSDNLVGLPGFDGRMEALGLLYYLADNCFIEYAKCSA